jgi:hypothetical protein
VQRTATVAVEVGAASIDHGHAARSLASHGIGEARTDLGREGASGIPSFARRARAQGAGPQRLERGEQRGGKAAAAGAAAVTAQPVAGERIERRLATRWRLGLRLREPEPVGEHRRALELREERFEVGSPDAMAAQAGRSHQPLPIAGAVRAA